MDEFEKRLALINREELKKYLLSLQMPCYESELFRIAFPDVSISDSDPLTLYQNHFLLFHLLYLLQNEFYSEGKYLHPHFMRTCLATYPEPGLCRYYDEHTGTFCESICTDGKYHCDFHGDQIGENEIEELSSKYFYLDIENFYRLNRETAEAFINGTWEMLKHYEDYKKSYKILGLPESADLPMIKKKFRELAKKHHPDTSGKAPEEFYKINRAYQLLLRLGPP